MQRRLIFEDLNDALREVVQVLGGAKVVGPALWPEKSVEQAHQLLLACLNAERKERLTPDQVLLLLRRGREADCHAAMQFIGHACGYDVTPVRPADQAALLIERAAALAQESRAVADALDRLARPALQAVKP